VQEHLSDLCVLYSDLLYFVCFFCKYMAFINRFVVQNSPRRHDVVSLWMPVVLGTVMQGNFQ
jgi:hypothetical protein